MTNEESWKFAPVPFLGILGSAVLGAGVFCPVVSQSDGAGVGLQAFDPTTGNIVLGAAALSFVLTWVFLWYRGLWVTGLTAAVVLPQAFLQAQRDAAAGKFAGLAWGWGLLAAGTVLILIAAVRAQVEW